MQATITSTVQCGGVSVQSTITREAEGSNTPYSDTIAAGSSGTLSTRTDDNTGVVAAAAGHGIVTSDTVDVYWATGVRYGMDATVSGDNITVDLGAGDVLPAQSTAVVITKQIEVNADFDGDDMVLFYAYANVRAHLDFQDSGGASLFALELDDENPLYWWASDTEIALPITGNAVAAIFISNGTTSAGTLKTGCLLSTA